MKNISQIIIISKNLATFDLPKPTQNALGQSVALIVAWTE
jgi:hypothetical protein